ncbi:MAG: hypothetical protein GEV11_09530 [Streptosporangiales bacterium]|nr:hypothetical protein [Streptosporangiales bacterium]
MTLGTVDTLRSETFLTEYLVPGRPVLVRGALAGWRWAPPWDLTTLAERFGGLRVPLYDTLFALRGLSTFGDYVSRHTRAAWHDEPPYLRWFSRQGPERLPWADDAFAALVEDWSVPTFLPDSGYVFPHPARAADPVRDSFPGKGIFVCGAGGRTRLHTDPWGSDACLCQAAGEKRVIMFPPAPGGFPLWRDARPAFDEILEPGDAVYIPAGWCHTVLALSDSVSLTWNFVHQVHAGRFTRHLAEGGAEDATVRYFR